MTEQGPSQPPRMSRRTFLTGLVGLGAAIGLPGCAPQTPDSKPSIPTTTIKGTVPDSTPSSTTAPTEAPTTTIDERVFTSPEQKAQIENVELAMRKFYELTPEMVASYKEQIAFRPEGSGFSTLSTQSPGYYNTMAINLGVFPTKIGTDGAQIGVYGLVREDGSKIVCSQMVEVLDAELVSKYPGFNINKGAGMVKVNDFGAYETSRAVSESAYDGELKGSDNVLKYLKDHVGSPIWFEYNVNPDWVTELHLTPNQLLLDTFKTINSMDGIKTLPSQIPSEQLQTIGIFTEESVHIPQEMLDGSGYPTVQEAFVHLPALATARFFTDVPSVLA